MCDCMSNSSFLNFYLYDLQIKSHWATYKRFYYGLYTKMCDCMSNSSFLHFRKQNKNREKTPTLKAKIWWRRIFTHKRHPFLIDKVHSSLGHQAPKENGTFQLATRCTFINNHLTIVNTTYKSCEIKFILTDARIIKYLQILQSSSSVRSLT